MGAERDEILEAVATREFPDREREPGHGRRREHWGDTRIVFEAGIEEGLYV
jgi:hypothetical protein